MTKAKLGTPHVNHECFNRSDGVNVKKVDGKIHVILNAIKAALMHTRGENGVGCHLNTFIS